MQVACYDSEKDNQPARLDVTWADVLELLTPVRETECHPCPPKCAHRMGPAWSPVDIAGSRANDNVKALTLAVFDLDHMADDVLIGILERLQGYRYIIHSTHADRPGDRCFRLVLALSRPALPKEWFALRQAAIALLGLPADPATGDLSRIYFLPSRPRGAAYDVEAGEGRALDVDALVSTSVQNVVPGAPSTAVCIEGGVTYLDDLKEAIAARRYALARSTAEGDEARYEVLDTVLGGRPFPPSSRNVGIHKALSLIAFAVPVGTPWEAILEVVRPSLSATERGPGDEDWFALAERSFRAACDKRAKLEAVKRLNEELRAGLLVPGRLVPGRALDMVQDEDDGAWRGLLIPKEDGGAALKSCGHNAAVLLEHAPEWRGNLRWNRVTKEIEVLDGPYSVSETLDTDVHNWLQFVHGISIGLHEVGAQLLCVARKKSYDPLADYLNALVWDGVGRLEKLLLSYFGAVDDEYTRAVSRCWMISAVARGLAPGSKVDTLLVLEGDQGIGKSSALSVLGGKWFCDTQINIGDKDSRQLASVAWIFELAEMASLRRSDTALLKNFFTQQFDLYRPPYGRVPERFPRRSVFVGTTNDLQYLTDDTGNRRYLPVRCTQIDVDGLARDRDQLWAEAVVRYKAKEPWWFTASEMRQAVVATEERMTPIPFLEEILDWWISISPEKRPEYVRTKDVAQSLLIPPDRVNHATLIALARALRALGFSLRYRKLGGRSLPTFEPSEELRTVPHHKRPSLLASVPKEAGQ